MGATYSNLTVRGPSHERVVAVMRALGREAYVGPWEDGCTVVFDSLAEERPGEDETLAIELSQTLRCAALAVTVFDGDVVAYVLCRGGEVLDRYDSNPGYNAGYAAHPFGGDAALLCQVIGAPGSIVPEVSRILRAPPRTEPYFDEEARHADLTDALGLPAYAVGLGYGYVFQGDAEDLEDELTPVGGAPPLIPDEDDESFLLPPVSARVAVEEHATLGRYYPALVAGDWTDVRALFSDEPDLDDPRHGRVRGADALRAFLIETDAWLGERAARWEPVAGTRTRDRQVEEGVLHLEEPGGRRVALPVALVGERAPGGGYARVRVYHSMWPLSGRHCVRAPLLEPNAALVLPDSVGLYQAALAMGDVDGVLESFEPGDAYAREPSGGTYLHSGAQGLRAFYSALFSAGGGIPLGHCTVTDDGVRCAVEYVVTRWGSTPLPPQAGVAVYERGSTGRLHAARIYDDVEPPLPHG